MDWSSTSGNSGVGLAAQSDVRWWANGTRPCNDAVIAMRLICAEQ
jgi:hypothetical protein